MPPVSSILATWIPIPELDGALVGKKTSSYIAGEFFPEGFYPTIFPPNPRSMGSNMVEAGVAHCLTGQCCTGLHSICVPCRVTTLEAGTSVRNHIAIRCVTALVGSLFRSVLNSMGIFHSENGKHTTSTSLQQTNTAMENHPILNGEKSTI